MWVSAHIPELMNGPAHQRLLLLAKAVLGEDMAFDFDMIISKVGLITELESAGRRDTHYMDLKSPSTFSKLWSCLSIADG